MSVVHRKLYKQQKELQHFFLNVKNLLKIKKFIVRQKLLPGKAGIKNLIFVSARKL